MTSWNGSQGMDDRSVILERLTSLAYVDRSRKGRDRQRVALILLREFGLKLKGQITAWLRHATIPEIHAAKASSVHW